MAKLPVRRRFVVAEYRDGEFYKQHVEVFINRDIASVYVGHCKMLDHAMRRKHPDLHPWTSTFKIFTLEDIPGRQD